MSIASGATPATRSGGLIAGGVADALGSSGAIAIVAGLTATSGLWVLGDMSSHRGNSAHAASRSTPQQQATQTSARARSRPAA